jgi:methyl-accepting chemotaxis protein
LLAARAQSGAPAGPWLEGAHMSFSTRWREFSATSAILGGGASQPLARLRALRSSWREFFRHHGVWAPGVRLHRRLDFRAKAMLVSAAFIVPTAVLALLQFSAAWRELADLSKAREMLVLAQSADELLRAVNAQRGALFRGAHLAPAEADAQARRIEAGWQHLEQAYVAGADARAVDVRFRALVEDFPLLTGPRVEGSQGEAVRQRTDFIGHLLDFNEALLLDTALGRDHLPDSRHRARLAMHLLPRIEQSLGTILARAQRLAAQSDHSVAAYQPYAAVFHSLPSLVERARTSALGLDDSPSDNGNPAHEGISESARLIQVLDRVQQRADALHRLVVVGPDVAELQSERAAVTVQRSELLHLQSAMMKRFANDLEGHWRHQRNAFIGSCALLALMLALAIYVLYAFFHVLRGGMRQIQREVQYVAEGDLSRRPSPLGRDEAALTLALITESLGNLGGLFSVVRRGVASVAHASTEIASASGDLSRGSDAALASVASVREGIGSMVGHLEGYEQCVQQAVERARAMRTESGRSRRVMGTLSERIAGLQQRSREIGKIVGMIDGIAFQTHLLSLNASVEAARAGEAGKGFAVVAHEVRQLSVRVANAAQQISAIVAASIAEIEQGRAITQRTVEAVVGTEAEVLGVNKVLQRLTELTSEGQHNARQMAGSLDQLHQFSESNAKLAEQMTDAAQELRRQSLQVSEQSSRFKLA